MFGPYHNFAAWSSYDSDDTALYPFVMGSPRLPAICWRSWVVTLTSNVILCTRHESVQDTFISLALQCKVMLLKGTSLVIAFIQWKFWISCHCFAGSELRLERHMCPGEFGCQLCTGRACYIEFPLELDTNAQLLGCCTDKPLYP